MTRIFLPLLLFLIPFTSYGQYQLPNPGFENWESNGEPTGFHSFNTATGSLSNFAEIQINYPNKAMIGLVVVEVLPQKFQREIFSGIMPMAT